MISLLAAELALSAWGPLAGTLGFSKRSIMNECRLTIAVQKATVVIERVVFPLFQVS